MEEWNNVKSNDIYKDMELIILLLFEGGIYILRVLLYFFFIINICLVFLRVLYFMFFLFLRKNKESFWKSKYIIKNISMI